MFANPKEADAVVDGPFGKMMHDKLEAKGIVGLAYWGLGFRTSTNSRRPSNKVDDIAGLKLRVIPNAINVDWVKALGANPTPLPFPEVYAALDQKAIDGQENPATVISANKLYEVQKHIVLSNHQYNPQSRSEEHTSELQSQFHLVCRLLLEKKKKMLRNAKFHTQQYTTN